MDYSLKLNLIFVCLYVLMVVCVFVLKRLYVWLFWVHRSLTSPNYVKQPRIFLLAPDTQITLALTALELL